MKNKFILILLTIFLAPIFATGCGNSNNDFVATNGNVAPGATTGTLVFNFTQATTQSVEVPNGTTDLRFEFFDSGNASVFVDQQPFAATVTVPNVPITASSVVITAYGAGGVPLATSEASVTVVPGGTNQIDLSGATVTPVTLNSISVTPNPIAVSLDGGVTTAQIVVGGTFSNGDTVQFNTTTGGTATYSGFDTLIATVDAGGLVTPVSSGSTTVDVQFTINGQTASLNGVPINVQGPAGQLIVEPAALEFAPGGLIGGIDDIIGLLSVGDPVDNVAFFRAYFIPAGETRRFDVTSRVGVSFSNFFPSTVTAQSFTYLNISGEGIGLTSNPLAPTPPFGGTATMTVTYINNGQVFTDNVEITLENPSLSAVEVQSAPNGTLVLPANGVNDFELNAVAVYSNGARFRLDDLDGGFNNPPVNDTFEIDFQTAATGLSFADVDGNNDGLDTTGGGAGQTAVVTITANGAATPITTFNVSLINAQVEEVALDVFPTDINPSSGYSVTVTYDDTAGTTQDITAGWLQRNTFNGPGEVGFDGLLEGAGRLLGVFRGEAELRIDSNSGVGSVTTHLNGPVGLPGSDTLGTNNSVNIDVLSTVPLSLINAIL